MANVGSFRTATPLRVRRSIVVFICTLTMFVLTLAGLALRQPSGTGTLSAAPFAETSPWRQTIPPDPMIDPSSAAMIASVTSEGALVANLVEFGIPVYTTSADDPTYRLDCTQGDWGVCPLSGWAVTIPDGAAPHSGSDQALVTIDERRGLIFELWQASKSGDQWSASWGGVNDLHGSGWGGAATGSGASRLAGVIRLSEIAAGDIPHALALQTSNACDTFRPPALVSDGKSTRADCIPQGARLQLDPALDLSTLDLTPGELAVATAMQRYGGYVMDSGGAPLSVSFELDTHAAPGAVGATYEAAGFRWDYDAMENVPWEMLRVLQ